jgi:hypothetical protein
MRLELRDLLAVDQVENEDTAAARNESRRNQSDEAIRTCSVCHVPEPPRA